MIYMKSKILYFGCMLLFISSIYNNTNAQTTSMLINPGLELGETGWSG